MCRCLPIALILALSPTAAPAADLIPGPMNARVVSVYDGDTLMVGQARRPYAGDFFSSTTSASCRPFMAAAICRSGFL